MPQGSSSYKHPSSPQCSGCPHPSGRYTHPTTGTCPQDPKAHDASKVTSGRFGKNRLNWTNNKLLKGAGPGADPVEIDVGVNATSGSFTGNGTANRAIAHGLGAVPKLVVFWNQSQSYYSFILGSDTDSLKHIESAGLGSGAVTAMTSTNFYVDNVYANGNGNTIYWVAIG